jgi:hypothetical protein
MATLTNEYVHWQHKNNEALERIASLGRVLVMLTLLNAKTQPPVSLRVTDYHCTEAMRKPTPTGNCSEQIEESTQKICFNAK